MSHAVIGIRSNPLSTSSILIEDVGWEWQPAGASAVITDHEQIDLATNSNDLRALATDNAFPAHLPNPNSIILSDGTNDIDPADVDDFLDNIERPQIYDAIVAPFGEEFDDPSAAFASGARSVFVRTGTYVLTSDVVIPDGGRLLVEEQGGAVFDGSGGFRVVADGSGGVNQSAGTISVTNNSAAVVGVGTTFTNLSAGQVIFIGQACYEIDSITDDLNLTLVEVYRGTTDSGISYIAQSVLKNVTIEGIVITDAPGTGLFLRAVVGCVLRDVIAQRCSTDIQIVDSCDVRVDHCCAQYATGPGLLLTSNRAISFTDPRVINNAGNGIQITGVGQGVALNGGVVVKNGIDGIDVTGTHMNVNLEDVDIEDNAQKGIDTQPATAMFTITGGGIRRNGWWGIDFDGAESSVENVEITDNSKTFVGGGIRAGDNGVISECQIGRNNGPGIELIFDTNNVILGNQIFENVSHGIDANSASTSCTIDANQIRGNQGFGVNFAAGASADIRFGASNVVVGNVLGEINNLESTVRFASESIGPGLQGTILHNTNGPAAPQVTDDLNAGYQFGSRWLHRATGYMWVCIDPTIGTAVWRLLYSDVSQQALTTDQQTSSGVFVPLPGLALALQKTDPNTDVEIHVHVSASGTTNFQTAQARVLVDGTPVGQAFGLFQSYLFIGASAGSPASTGWTFKVSGLAVGARNITIEWRTAGGTVLCRPATDDDEAAVVTARELVGV